MIWECLELGRAGGPAPSPKLIFPSAFLGCAGQFIPKIALSETDLRNSQQSFRPDLGADVPPHNCINRGWKDNTAQPRDACLR
jgi:hypothetical protein